MPNLIVVLILIASKAADKHPMACFIWLLAFVLGCHSVSVIAPLLLA